MTEVKDFIFEDRIFQDKFTCDLDKCKGVCCTVPGTLGAPVHKEELKVIESLMEKVLSLLSEDKQRVIITEGFYEKWANEYYLNTLEGNDCVFSYYENDIAKCIFQKLYNENAISFKKPLSCELFPIRMSKIHSVTNFRGKWFLRYEECVQCKPAVIKGNTEDISIFEYCKEALKRIMEEEDIETARDKYFKKRK